MAGGLARFLGTALLAQTVASAALPSPQNKPGPAAPIIQVGVDLIRIDASVTDKAGRPLPDLAPSDFILEVDGARRPIGDARFLTGDTAAGEAKAALPGLDRSVVFVVDDLSIPATSLAAAKQALRGFSSSWSRARAQAGVRLTSDRSGAITLTRSPEQFARAIEDIHLEVPFSKELLPRMPAQAYPSPVDLDLSPMKVEHIVFEGEGLTIDTTPVSLDASATARRP